MCCGDILVDKANGVRPRTPVARDNRELNAIACHQFADSGGRDDRMVDEYVLAVIFIASDEPKAAIREFLDSPGYLC